MGQELTTTNHTLKVLSEDIGNVREVLQENLGATGLTEFDLDRIKIPAGGGTLWMVPSIEGEEALKDLCGVVVAWRDVRSYWATEMGTGEANQPPDCSSSDSLIGIGQPGGQCLGCALAKFGSGKGNSQACKQMRQLFMLRGENLLPSVVSMPPSSLKAAKQFFTRLASFQIPYWSAEIRIGLEKAKNPEGISYSKATFALVRKLDGEEAARAKAYMEMLKPMLAHAPINFDAQEAAA